jgi:hypothetical protein
VSWRSKPSRKAPEDFIQELWGVVCSVQTCQNLARLGGRKVKHEGREKAQTWIYIIIPQKFISSADIQVLPWLTRISRGRPSSCNFSFMMKTFKHRKSWKLKQYTSIFSRQLPHFLAFSSYRCVGSHAWKCTHIYI